LNAQGQSYYTQTQALKKHKSFKFFDMNGRGSKKHFRPCLTSSEPSFLQNKDDSSPNNLSSGIDGPLVRLGPKRDADWIYRRLRKIRKDQVTDYLSQIETFQESILDGSTQHPIFPFTKTSPIEFLTSTSQNPSHKNLSTSK
jgi:hypothetical protein